MKADACIVFDSEAAETACLESLRRVYQLQNGDAQQVSYVYLDTFDWRLYSEGLCLLKAGRELQLRRLVDDRVVAGTSWPKRKLPATSDEIADPALRKELDKLCRIRALQPKVELTARTCRYAVLDENGKTVLRTQLASFGFKDNSTGELFLREWRIQPLKGYEKESKRFCEYTARYGSWRHGELAHPLAVALRESGIDPHRYSPNRNLGFSPELPAYLACRSVLDHALEVVEVNEQGILDDTDTEFLHHYRVALRQAKSALGMFKEVLPPEETEALKAGISRLARTSNAVRDLDVFLLKRQGITARLPGALDPGVREFFRRLKTERTRELKALCKFMRSDELPAVKLQWRTFTAHLANPAFSIAPGVPVFDIARRNIRKRYDRIVKRGARLGPNSQEDPFHELRIEFKKLRYNLEFFRSLFPGKDIRAFIKQLRQMQNLLGDLNDIKVQRDFLTERLERLDLRSKASANIAASLGALIARLEESSLRQREAFPAAFAPLIEGKMKNTADRLFCI